MRMAWGLRSDMIVHSVEPLNAEPPRARLGENDLTDVDTFYVRNHGPVLDIVPDLWCLRVGGLVDRPFELSLADLRHGFARHDVVAVLECAGNRRAELMKVRDMPGEPWGCAAVGNARWTGARLADVLAAAGIGDRAAHVAFQAPDVSEQASPPQPFGASIPLGKALSPEVLLAYAMNGQPLPQVHGAPVRVVVPGYIGARSVKWVEQITVQAEPSANFFQTSYQLLPAAADLSRTGPGDGFTLGPLAVNAAILTPDEGATVPVGPVTVAGYALTGDHRHVTRVDISADGGHTWRQATLDQEISPWSWRRWHATLDLPAGQADIAVRAWDNGANAQPSSEADLWNPKGYANNARAHLHLNVDRRTRRL
jgi:sulfite oxidase